MRAVRGVAGGGVEVVSVDPPDSGVRVTVRSAGICGSDLHLAAYGLPVTLGHEFAGVLDDGTPVVVQPNVPCGSCDRCEAGEGQLCRTGLERVHGVSLDGGLADVVAVNPGCVIPLPEGVGVESAALVEPLAVAVHAIHRVDGESLLVVGGGSIGLLTVAAAVAAGHHVDVVARHDVQRVAGEALGARVVGEREAREYDAVVDAAGSQSSLELSVDRVRPGGTVVVVATWWAPVSVGTTLLTKEVRLVPAAMYGHHHGDREFEQAVGVLAATPSLADVVVTHRFGLDDAAEAFRVAGDRAAGAVKVVLAP